MNRIKTIFDTKSKKLMPFLVAGDPSIETSEGAIVAMAEAGADIIEIGIPFSDPIADGPVIAKAMHRALGKGVTPAHAIGMISRVRSKVDVGLIAMVSYSIVRRSGGTACLDRFAEAGADGFIIPDIDDIDAATLSAHCEAIGTSFSMLVAPTTPLCRVEQLSNLSSGFLYILARTGLTGEQNEMPELSTRIAEIRSVTDLPLAVGFGISTSKHVEQVHASADAAIVGSALVRRMDESKDAALAAKQFVSDIS
ncbi:MAG: tryptophan synthase subunit alpha [Phycisphaerales bacterium]|nr:tryptophan synthase subunit alpha [Planctomycetota bacterium]MBL6997222.1 tryptophan synthase subunit alpha [Phycisphaerales bacterium]